MVSKLLSKLSIKCDSTQKPTRFRHHMGAIIIPDAHIKTSGTPGTFPRNLYGFQGMKPIILAIGDESAPETQKSKFETNFKF